MSIKERLSTTYLMYALTIFLSAFLLFVIQPIAGKYLLPYFGGSSSVWATSLLFFTGMLFVGYAYVYVLAMYDGRKQAIIHACVVAFALFLSIASLFSQTQVLAFVNDSPAIGVLFALFVMIGAPYFLLSTTGPLLQYWYGLTSDSEPYKLYALSNAGSLLALIGYIFLIEPFIPLSSEKGIWTVLFVAYTIVTLVITLKFLRNSSNVSRAQRMQAPAVHARTALMWVAYAAIPALLLLATTTTITQTVAPVPLLWIMPLMLYLGALILAFGGRGQSIYVPALVLVSLYFAYDYRGAGPFFVSYEVGANLALLFLGSLFFSAELYRSRPSVQRLPLFYLLISFGGMLGILLGSILAPVIFTDFWEFTLCMAIIAALAGWKLSEDFFPRILDAGNIRLIKIAFGLLSFGLFFNLMYTDTGAPFIASRNFYGAVKVRFQDQMTVLMHGSTIHGYQSRMKEWQHAPSGYYVPSSGFGRAMLYELSLRRGAGKDGDLRAGIVGLGTGSIAAYCRPGDTFVYYEIDPRIVQIARTNFSYLQNCDGIDVHMGDGRLSLEQELRDEQKGEYDILVLDAFTDDTIPVHLLTYQAFAMYASHLRSPQSIIAVHTSNRYLDLPPVVLKIALQLGFTGKIIRDSGSSSEMGTPSVWVLLVKDPKAFAAPVFTDAHLFLPPDVKQAPLWTDDYTSLLSVLRI